MPRASSSSVAATRTRTARLRNTRAPGLAPPAQVSAPVDARPVARSPPATSPALCGPQPGTEEAGRHALPALAGVPRGAFERLRLQPILRAVSPMGRRAEAVDAPGASG